MPFRKSPSMDRSGVERIAQGWGKVVARRVHDEVGMFVYHLMDEIAERYLDLIDDLDDEIDELEDMVADKTPAEVGHRLRELREDVRGIRRTLAPTRDAVRKVVDDRISWEV